MKALWRKYAARYEALSPRERWMVFAAGLLGAVALVYFVWIDPAQRRQKVLLSQMERDRGEIAALQTRLRAAPAQPDPDAASRVRAEALRRDIAALDETLRALQRELVPADRVNALLQDMVARDGQLTLVSLRTLPVALLAGRDANTATNTNAAAATAPPKTEAARGIVYKHGVEITLQGSYSHLHDYLTRLERSASRVYWWRAQLAAHDDGPLTLTVTVYTLSLDKAWLQV